MDWLLLLKISHTRIQSAMFIYTNCRLQWGSHRHGQMPEKIIFGLNTTFAHIHNKLNHNENMICMPWLLFMRTMIHSQIMSVWNANISILPYHLFTTTSSGVAVVVAVADVSSSWVYDVITFAGHVFWFCFECCCLSYWLAPCVSVTVRFHNYHFYHASLSASSWNLNRLLF